VLVSKHPARQFPLLSLWPLRISRSRIGFKRFPCHPSPYDWLSQSSWQVVTPATTTVTPSPLDSHLVGDPVFRHHETYRAQRRCLTHHLAETSLVPILPTRVPRTATLFQVEKGSGFKRSARGRVLPSSVIEVRAILPSPYCAELASLRLQRFGLVLAFAACCCSVFLSESGKPVFLECPSNSSRLRRRSHRA
jgi:hypothetical protein